MLTATSDASYAHHCIDWDDTKIYFPLALHVLLSLSHRTTENKEFFTWCDEKMLSLFCVYNMKRGKEWCWWNNLMVGLRVIKQKYFLWRLGLKFLFEKFTFRWWYAKRVCFYFVGKYLSIQHLLPLWKYFWVKYFPIN